MRKYLSYVITALSGVLAAFAIMCAKGIFSQTSLIDVYHILSDSFFVPGVVIMCVGLLCFASNGGVFDMLAYSIRMIFDAMRRHIKDRKYKDFYEYREARKEKKRTFGYLLIVGLFYTLLGVLFTILWLNS